MPSSEVANDADARPLSRLDRMLWGAYSNVYDSLLDFVPYRTLIEDVAEHADLDHAKTLLDLGCGTGNFLRLAAGRNPALIATGVDAAPSMLARAQRKVDRSRVTLVEADIVGFLRQVEPASFDRIVSVNSLYTLGDRDEFWRLLLGALAPHGRAVVASPTTGGRLALIRDHLRSESFVSLLRPSLAAVFLVDAAIGVMARTPHFDFAPAHQLEAEIRRNGGVVVEQLPCYAGMDALFVVRRG